MLKSIIATFAVIGAACAAQSSALAQTAAEASGANALISYPSLFHSVEADHGMVVAQDRLAAEVGRDMLKRGGNVVDAAVAAGFALAVTHPQAGNLGGGGFMLIKLADREDVIAIDFREMAPAGASRDMFLDEAGNVDNLRARFSHLSAGVPGTVMGLATALEKYGTMSLKDVMKPAIRLAEKGFPATAALADSLAEYKERFERDPSSLRYFLKDDGSAYARGEKIVQKDLARTLKAIAAKGAAGFYEGPVADLIVAEMRANGGLITHEDLKNYRAVERKAVTGEFRGFEIVSMPPPSSGGVHLIEMLNVLEGYDLEALGHNSADYLGLLVEAMRRAYADRSEYLGDPDFYEVPIAALLDEAYAKKLRGEISFRRASKSEDVRPGLGPRDESEETTHLSVMDAAGNAVAVTTTLNFTFGSSYSVDGAGFLLNNEMDDFSAKPGAPNGFGLIGDEANEIAPKKRPLSSMTPTIVMKDGKAILATGTPGGSTIINIVLQNILNILEFGMSPMQANAMPKVHHQWLPDRIITEPGVPVDAIRIMEERGFIFARGPDGALQQRAMGRTNTIMLQGGKLFGAPDPREPDGGAGAF
ncbi:MAG: gamma-glutamyltransferase [Parvularculaceae bacterium]|nr:gamma-glutamyltransferase [Parvularculaceae bacterium]